MKSPELSGRCFRDPLKPCICPLKPICQKADRKIGIDTQAHGAVVEAMASGSPVAHKIAEKVLAQWRGRKQESARRMRLRSNLCERK